MNRNYWRGFIALLWLALPVMALRYWLVWDRLPVRMASHFDAAGNPNGWMSREQSLVFTLGFLAFMVTVSSVILYAIHRNDPISTLSWGLVAFFHIEIWTIVVLLNSTLRYNLDGSPISVAPLLLITPVAILGVIGIGFAEKRGVALPPTDVLAEEVHSGRLWGAIFAIPLVAAGAVVAVVPNPTMRFGAGSAGPAFHRRICHGLGWFSLLLHPPRSGDPHPGVSPEVDSRRPDQTVRGRELESDVGLWNSRTGQS